jgi:tetratricopeptide (TPR) repeat protein
VPGWHARTEELERAGRLRVAGLATEQHGDRTRLFMQWHQMEWPVMVDSLNLIGVQAVPITLLLDEHGIIRYSNPKPGDLERFLETDYPAPEKSQRVASPEVAPEMAFAMNAIIDHRSESYDQAITGVEKLAAAHPEDAETHFRLGVLFRKRHDSAARKADDFAKAVAHWSRALELNPNQYIWRRRIQQYGPRLDKPYSFYDWIAEARKVLRERGETPVELEVEPSGAEFATPSKSSSPHDPSGAKHPDPDGRLARDTAPLVRIESIVVPSTDAKSPAFRVHLVLTPDGEQKAHWNNESGESALWLDAPEGWSLSENPLALPLPENVGATSEETRHLEFELLPSSKSAIAPELTGAVFYFICEGENGTCLYLRQDIRLRPAKP